MNPLLSEINEIPRRASEFIKSTPQFELPLKVPYLGMGSSYFAPSAFKYMGIKIYPEIASDYFNYIYKGRKISRAVLISQSGESSEVLWCAKLFKEYVAVTNNAGSTLSRYPNVRQTIRLLAGDEKYSSSKTYINTLLTLFKGFGFRFEDAVSLLSERMSHYDAVGKKMADDVFEKITGSKIHGIYITGSGPNIATAMEASLILSESTKICFTGMPMAQYDHGPKETAARSIVIQILARGRSYERIKKLSGTIAEYGAFTITVEEPDAEENFSVLHNIIPFNFMAAYLAEMLNIAETFTIGGKITKA